uniref:RRM domain-containing protein n=1 Tax=Phytophthora ramorum TaxID=164328 RepID=H3GHD2_PHYRM
MMMQTTRSWEDLRSSARAAERTLEDKVAAYTAVSRAQARSAAAAYDEENPPEETADERELAVDIENALAALSDTIDEMNAVVNKTSVKTQDAMLQRYRELYFDFNTEFRRSLSVLQEKRDAQKLFGNRTHNGHSDDVEMDSLLNERRAVDSSRSMTSSIIEQAMATKNALENQRRQFTSSHGKVATLGGSFAGINTLVEQIRRKKMRNNTILALVIAGCICFTLCMGDRGGISLLVRNISRRLRPEDIRKEFERYGEVRDVYIPKDFYTKEPKGFAFVEFRSEREADDARRSLDGVRIDGRDIRVVFAQERRRRNVKVDVARARDRRAAARRVAGTIALPFALGFSRPFACASVSVTSGPFAFSVAPPIGVSPCLRLASPFGFAVCSVATPFQGPLGVDVSPTG